MANLFYGTQSSAHAYTRCDWCCRPSDIINIDSIHSGQKSMDWKIFMMPTYLHGKGSPGGGEHGAGRSSMQLPRVELNWKLATGNGQPAVAWCEVCQNGKSWQLRMQSGPLAGQEGGQGLRTAQEGREGDVKEGCSAINRHKNKLQLPSMNKFPCNLLCILFF